jgi:ribosomal protein S17
MDLIAKSKQVLDGHIVEVETMQEANYLAKYVEQNSGIVAHVNIAIRNGDKPSVELCQGAHCSCRY